MTYPDRHDTLRKAADGLVAMQGILQEVRALLFDLPDVSICSPLVNSIEPMIEVAHNAVLEAWDGEP